MNDTAAPPDFNKSYTTPRSDVVGLISRAPHRLLDVGCSDGSLGESIKRRWPACHVAGMELSPAMGAVAAQRIDQVHICDVEAPDSMTKFAGQRFDTVVFADILEHLRDPWEMLRRVRPLLQDDAVIVGSIPNIRHIDTIYNLVLRGEWPYRDRGIHDRTHLRFFTRKNILELFSSAGFTIAQMKANYRLIERPHSINRYASWFAVPGLSPFLTFQYLIVAKPE